MKVWDKVLTRKFLKADNIKFWNRGSVLTVVFVSRDGLSVDLMDHRLHKHDAWKRHVDISGVLVSDLVLLED